MKLSKNDSLLLLYSLKASLNMGITLQKAIELQSRSQKNAIGKLLKKVNYLVTKENYKTSEALYETELISNEEALLLDNSNDPKTALELIIETKELGGQFTKTLISIFWFPIFAVVFGLLAANKLLPIFLKPYEILVNNVAARGIPVDELKEFPPVFAYINHADELMKYLTIYLIVVAIIIVSYLFLRTYHAKYIYKIFPLAAYDDLPFILTYMKGLKSVGLPTKKVFDILAKSQIKYIWKKLFIFLLKAVDSKKEMDDKSTFSPVFQKFGYPDEVINFLKYAEESNNFWNNISNLIEFVKEKNKMGNEFLKKTLGKVFNILAYIILLYFIMGPILIMLKMQTIQSAMM